MQRASLNVVLRLLVAVAVGASVSVALSLMMMSFNAILHALVLGGVGGWVAVGIYAALERRSVRLTKDDSSNSNIASGYRADDSGGS